MAKAVIVRTKREVARAGRQLHPVRRQLGGPHQQGQRADRDPHLRAGRPRAARQEVHEDHLARAGGALSDAEAFDKWRHGQVVRRRAARTRASAARSCAIDRDATASSSRALQLVKRHIQGRDRSQPAGRHPREGRARIALSNVCRWSARSATRRPASAIRGRRRQEGPRLQEVRREHRAQGSDGSTTTTEEPDAPTKRRSKDEHEGRRRRAADKAEGRERRPSGKGKDEVAQGRLRRQHRGRPRGEAGAAEDALPQGGRPGADEGVRLQEPECRCRGWRRSSSTWASARR